MTELENIALSVGRPPYSVKDIIRIQQAVYKQTKKHLSYGRVVEAIADIDKPGPPKPVKTRPCIYCGTEFPATGQRSVCDECKRAQEWKRRREWTARKAVQGGQ